MDTKLIIFDMDGTLVNSSLTIANAINYVRNKLDLPPLEKEYILRLVNDHTINPAQVFYDSKNFEAQHEEWFTQYYTSNHENELVLYDGIMELLDELKEKEYLLAIATNAYRSSTIESLTHFNIYNYFDAIACYDDVPNGKPHPDMLLKLLKELKQSSQNSLFIGDGPRDEEASKRANIPYIMVDWGFTEHTDAISTVEALKEQILLIN